MDAPTSGADFDNVRVCIERIAPIEGTNAILYYSGSVDFTTYVHEFGHLLGLKHAFESKPYIVKGSSRNFMDYAPVTDMFWKLQWGLIRSVNKK